MRSPGSLRNQAEVARPTRMRLLLGLAALLAVVCAVIYWPSADSGIPGARRLDAAELRALPADAEGDRLLGHHLGCLAFGHGGSGSWQDLPEPAHHVWATIAFESQTALGLTLFFLGERKGGPALDEAAAAYRALGDAAAAEVAQTLGRLNATSPADALAAMEQRLAAIRERMPGLRHAYVAEHAEEIAGGR